MYVHKAQKMAKVVGKVRTSAQRAHTVHDECLYICTLNHAIRENLAYFAALPMMADAT